MRFLCEFLCSAVFCMIWQYFFFVFASIGYRLYTVKSKREKKIQIILGFEMFFFITLFLKVSYHMNWERVKQWWKISVINILEYVNLQTSSMSSWGLRTYSAVHSAMNFYYPNIYIHANWSVASLVRFVFVYIYDIWNKHKYMNTYIHANTVTTRKNSIWLSIFVCAHNYDGSSITQANKK